MADRIVYVERQNRGGCGGAIILSVIVVLAIAMCSPNRDEAPQIAASTSEERIARRAECQEKLDRSMEISSTLRIRGADRIEIDDRLWAEMSADAKRGLAMTWLCVAFDGKRPDELEAMDYVVVYGDRSGQRLAMAGSTGVTIEPQ